MLPVFFPARNHSKGGDVIRTELCEMLGIEHPIIQPGAEEIIRSLPWKIGG